MSLVGDSHKEKQAASSTICRSTYLDESSNASDAEHKVSGAGRHDPFS